MDAIINFIFRSKLYQCEALVDDSEFPPYVFVILYDKELIAEFGNDITLKTDFETLLPRKDDTLLTLDLRQTIFAALKNTNSFQQAKEKWQAKRRAYQSFNK